MKREAFLRTHLVKLVVVFTLSLSHALNICLCEVVGTLTIILWLVNLTFYLWQDCCSNRK